METQAHQIPKLIKKRPRSSGETCVTILRFRNGCKNSGKIVDDEIPLQGGSHASSSHEASLEPTTKRREDLGKHNVHTHFPKDRNCEICKRTKITRAPCRRRNGEAVPRAVNFGDLITADHKVLSDNCESRNNHRYAVVVQDLATQWIQAYPCKNKTSQETQRSLQKFLEPERKPKVIYTDNSLEFGKACEDLSWNHCTGPGGWGPQGRRPTGGGGLARVPNLRVCKHLYASRWHTQGEMDELTSCRGTV